MFAETDTPDPAPRRAGFSSLHLEEHTRRVDPRHMRDPQQAFGDGGDFLAASSLVVGGRRTTGEAVVEPAVFERMDRLSREAELRAAHGAAAPHLTAAEQAQALIAEARETARTMLAQARDVIAAERAQSVAAGRAEGREQGRAEAEEELVGLVRTAEQIGINVMEERARVLDEREADVVELAIAIARRVVGAAIDVDHELVVEACRGAMRKAFQRGSMQVLAHPDDLALLREAGPRMAGELGGVEHLDFIEERRLDRGSVVVRTPAGEIDGTIAGKRDKIEAVLREGIEQRRAERRAA